MYLLTVRILFCVLSIAVSHVAANDACTKPFQQHPTRTDLCYTSLPRRKCYWIAGSVYLKGNCFVPSGYDGIPSRKFFCDFNEYFQHCKNVPGYCCMQSTKFECDKYTVVEYNATLGTCFAPVGEINLRTSNNVKCLKRFKYDDSFRQCVADLKPTKRGLTAAQCKKAGGYVNETKCIAEVIQRIKKPSDCTNVTNPDCLPPPFTTTTLLPTTTFETTEPTTTDEPKTTMPASTGTTRNDSSSDGLTSTTSQPPTANTDKMIHDPTIGQVEANAACQVPFQQHPTRPDLCYTRLPKRKCDWIPGSRFIQGNCFVPSGHDVVPSRKFFCDFNEYFQHCKNVPGYCCMQSTKFECDKYTVVEYNATLGTCFAPVGQISIRTADNVDCPKPFEYDDSFRQCVADVDVTSSISREQCEAVGGHTVGNKCVVEPIPLPQPQPNCTNVTDPACLPPPFPTPTSKLATTGVTTEPVTDISESTTATDSTTSKPKEHMTTLDSTRATRNPPTYGTDKTTHDATKTTDSININTTPVTQQTAKISDFTGSNTVTELTTSKPTERVVPDPTGITTTRNGSSIDGLTTTTPLPPTSGPNVECPNLFIYDDALKQCVVDGNIPNHELTETECKAAGGHINGTKCVTEVVKPTSSQPSCTDITDPACLPPPFEMTTLTPITTVETTSSTRTDEPETTTAMDFTTPKSTEHTTTSDIAGLSGGTTRTLTSGSTGVTKNESSSDGRTTTTPQPSTSGPEKTTYDPLKMTDSNVTADTIAPSMTKTTGGTASEIVTTNNITPEPTGVTKNGSSSDSSTTTTTQPPTAGTDKTTIKPPTTLNVTGSETVTTTPPETSPSLNSTSNGTSATSIPYSTGATSFTTQNIPTSTNPATLNASMPSTLTRNLTNQNFDFNISHNCPIGFMITSHFCIGVWTPDCETKHNGYKYEEACFIRFDDSGSNVGKREIACDNLGATVKSNGANITELSTSTALETTTTATTTTTTTTTIKPPQPPPQCRNIWTSCWKQRELCGDPTWFLRMINNCAVTCGYCHCQKNLINCRINHQYDRPPPPLPPRPAPYCRDIGSNCEKRLCNISKGYHDLYFINCKRTCGYC